MICSTKEEKRCLLFRPYTCIFFPILTFLSDGLEFLGASCGWAVFSCGLFASALHPKQVSNRLFFWIFSFSPIEVSVLSTHFLIYLLFILLNRLYKELKYTCSIVSYKNLSIPSYFIIRYHTYTYIINIRIFKFEKYWTYSIVYTRNVCAFIWNRNNEFQVIATCFYQISQADN